MKFGMNVTKRLLALCLALTMVLGFVVPMKTEAMQLLGNGSFDNNLIPLAGDGTALSTGEWTAVSWAFGIDEAANAHTGNRLAHLVYATDGLPAGEFPTIYQDVAVQPNSVYRLTFWVKYWNVNAAAQPLYYGYRNALQDVWTPVEQYVLTDLDGTYRQITMEINTKELTNIRIFAFTTSTAGGFGGYHLDDFSLEFVREIKTEESSGLLADGSFNTAMVPMMDANALSTGVWTNMSLAFSAQELANARSGMGLANMIYAADGLPGGEFPTIYQDVAVAQNSIYRLTFYAKHWNFGAEAQPLYFGYRNALQDVWTPVEQVTVTDLGGEYTQLTLEFDTKELTNIRIFAFTTSVLGGIGGYHLDDFKLEYVRAAEIPETEDPDALLKNGGFLQNMVTMTDGNLPSQGNWTSMSWASTAYEKENAHTGNSMANMIYAADGLPGGEFPTIYQDVAVAQNSIYRLTFYAKHWNFGAEAQPLYFGYRNALQDVWTPVEQVTVTDLGGEYTQLTLEFDTKELTNIRIFAFTTSVLGGIGGYHLDDFKLEYVRAAEIPETEDPDALLKNGGFLQNMVAMTDGNLPSQGNWTSMSWASTAYEKENAHTGNSMANMIYAADGLPAGEFPTIYQDVAVAQNSIYRLTFYAKHWNFGAEAQPLYFGYRNALQDVWTPVEQVTVTDLGNEYTQLTLEFDTKELTNIRIFAFTTSVLGGIGGYHLDDFKLEYVKEAEVMVPVAQIGTQKYESVQAALAASGTDAVTVQLIADSSESDLSVGAGVTLDLNGHTLVAENFVSFGDVIDTAENTGALIAQQVSLSNQSTYMAIYDANANGYRFFAYEERTLGVRETAENTVAFGFGIHFNNAAAYELLANTSTHNVSVQMTLAWGDQNKTFVLSAELLQRYAQLTLKYPQFTSAMMLTVTGLDALESGAELVMTPGWTAAGATCTGSQITYLVPGK